MPFPRSNLDVPPGKKPTWLRVTAPGGESYVHIKEELRRRDLHTVCEEARCPNVGECWRGGTATFMLLGDTCTRACSFCAVKTGNPKGAVDAGEPAKLAEAVAALDLKYVVLTTVDRDDLEDGGAAHYAATVRAIKERDPQILVEVLTGDFQGRRASIARVVDSRPEVFAHNVETVERLTPAVRDPRASYRQSLEVLETARSLADGSITKSSIMVGVGETRDEVVRTMKDLRASGVELLTIGQYLRPSPKHLPVAEYWSPERFEDLRDEGLSLGFLHVASGPLVRSSYRAGEHFVREVLFKRGSKKETA
ncbi:MAG: lipoyl synthase [Planctomycetota bacterium JB042]